MGGQLKEAHSFNPWCHWEAATEDRHQAAFHFDCPAFTTGVVDHQIDFGAARGAV